MDEEKKTMASDVLFGNVYQISEDMIQATYKIVEETSRFQSIFSNMAKKLVRLNANLNRHIVKHKWVKGLDKKKCQLKIEQAQELIAICEEYSKTCQATGNELIAITERFEGNKKIKGIIKNLVDKIEGEAKKLKENPKPTEEEDED